MKKHNPILDSKVENILVNKIQLLVGLCVAVAPIVCFFWRIQLDISLIKQNHEMHIEYALEEIAELKAGEKEIWEKVDTQQEVIIRLLEINGK